jgi:hypothetical protein
MKYLIGLFMVLVIILIVSYYCYSRKINKTRYLINPIFSDEDEMKHIPIGNIPVNVMPIHGPGIPIGHIPPMGRMPMGHMPINTPNMSF